MKKILAVIGALVMVPLFVIGSSSAPASAACPAAHRTAYKEVLFEDNDVNFYLRLHFIHCSTYKTLTRVTVGYYDQYGGPIYCGGARDIHVNPGAILGMNLPYTDFGACNSGGETKVYYISPYRSISDSNVSTDRCLGASIWIDNRWWRDYNGSIPEVCLPR